MNIELLKQVRDAIEMEPDMYEQFKWGIEGNRSVSCNTPGCIAGHAISIERMQTGKPFQFSHHIGTEAEILLDITHYQAKFLFDTDWPRSWKDNDAGPLPDHVGDGQFSPTSEDAIQVLDRIIEHGFGFE